MRFNTQVTDKTTADYLRIPSQTQQDSLEPFLKDLQKTKGFFLDLNKRDSSSSASASDSGRSESSFEDKNDKSKHQITLERRHRNFQIKKKTEVKYMVIFEILIAFQLCKTFQLGLQCPYGAKCSFAHGYEELRGKILVPTNYKTIRCKQFFEQDYCNYGPRCQFLHKQAIEKTGPSTVGISYVDIFDGMMAAHEYVTSNEEEITNFPAFLEQKINMENYGMRRMPVFEECIEEF